MSHGDPRALHTPEGLVFTWVTCSPMVSAVRHQPPSRQGEGGEEVASADGDAPYGDVPVWVLWS